MHTQFSNIVIRMKIDIICKSSDFHNATFSSYNLRNVLQQLLYNILPFTQYLNILWQQFIISF